MLYKNRDIKEQGQFYINHVEAMTKEELYHKGDIAAELAHRDIKIFNLKREIEHLERFLAESEEINKRYARMVARA